MSAPARPAHLRPTQASLQWAAASAVVLHAALARFAPDGSLALWILLLALGGALLGASPLRVAGRRERLGEALLGAAGAVLLGLGLRYALAPLPTGLAELLPWAGLLVLLLVDLAALRRLVRLFGVEWLKARRSVLFRGGLLGTAAITLLAALTYERLPGATGWSLLAHSMGAGLWGAEVFVLVLGATAISGEATGGTLKMMMPHAYRRSDWIVAKTLVLLLVALLLGIVVLLVSGVHAHAALGLGDVTRELEPLFGETEGQVETFQTMAVMRGHLLDVALAGLAALGTTALIGILLSSLFDGVIVSLCTAFLLFAGLKFADVLLRLPRETLQGIYAWYPEQLGELAGKLGRALNERWDQALLPEGLSLALLTSALALLLGVRAFARRDLHA